MTNYELVVGLEIHIQLNTKSKLFASDHNQFGTDANTNISSITLALPGSLPKINAEAVKKAIQMGIATNCAIADVCYFDRKNYFYPDLPKGFQTTQDNKPICKNGFLEIDVNGTVSKIRINRIHMEEDAGKSIHDISPDHSLIDLNRAGTPLLELVTEPDIRSAEEAYQFVTAVRQIARYINVSDGNMQEGSLRCDANVSVRKKGEKELRNRVEIKNLNSIRFIKKAIEGEFKRQVNLYESDQNVIQQTRGYNASDNTTFEQRGKEMAFDYRYFPEPDLPPVRITKERLDKIKSELPALPAEVKNDLKKNYQLNEYNAALISNEKEMVNFYKSICEHTSDHKSAANWLLGPVKGFLNDKNITIENFPLEAKKIAEIINFIENGIISRSAASSSLFKEMLNNPNSETKSLINSLNLSLNTDESWLEALIDEVLSELSDKVAEYKKGKKGLLGMFIGSVVKKSNGKVNPKTLPAILEKKLKEF